MQVNYRLHVYVILAWLCTFAFVSIWPSIAVEWIGIGLGTIGASLAYALVMWNYLSRWQIAVTTPLVLAAPLLYIFTYLIPPPPVISTLFLLSAGGIMGLLSMIFLHSYRRQPSASARYILILTMIIWWGCWGVSAISAPAPIIVDDQCSSCVYHMKRISYACSEYRSKYGKNPPDIESMVSKGLLKKSETICPTGGSYALLTPKHNLGNSSYQGILLCMNHPSRILVLDRSGKLRIFFERKRWKHNKIDGKLWWDTEMH